MGNGFYEQFLVTGHCIPMFFPSTIMFLGNYLVIAFLLLFIAPLGPQLLSYYSAGSNVKVTNKLVLIA